MSLPKPECLPEPAPASSTHQTEVVEVTPRQTQAWLQAGEAVLIDVREPDEHARERITSAHPVPLSRFDPRQAASKARPGQRIVMHCRGGRRSADACRLAASLTASGFAVFSMTGGIEAWKKDSLPVETDTTVTRISVMRQVQLTIGLMVLAGSALAWLVHPGFIGIPAFLGAGLLFAGATGTCALASLIAMMPWNRSQSGGASCSSGRCG